jgi:hypothetical protein
VSNRTKRERRYWKRKNPTGFVRPRRISLRAKGRLLAKALDAAAKQIMKQNLGLSAPE